MPRLPRPWLLPLLIGAIAWPVTAGAEGESLVELELCRDVKDRVGVGCGDAFPAGVGQVHAMLAVRVPPGRTGEVRTVWRRGAQVVQRQTLPIRFHRPGGYRTRSRQRIGRGWRGRWSVEVLDSADRSLAVRRFEIGVRPTDAAPAAAGPADGGAGDRRPIDGGAANARPSDGRAPDADPPAESDDAGPGASPDAGRSDADDESAIMVFDGAITVEADAAPPPVIPAAITPAPAAPTSATSAGDDTRVESRRQGGVMLLVGGLLLLIAGIVIARRRSARAMPTGPSATPGPAPAAGGAAAAADGVRVAAVPMHQAERATEALQGLTDLVTGLWSRWVATTGGSPQRALNTAWRAIPDPGRLGLDHIRLCNALERAAQDYASIPPRGTSVDILRVRLHRQSPALMGVICALAVECERLGLEGVGLDKVFEPWGGRAGSTAALLAVLDDAAAALGTTRLPILPYETKATTASRDFGVELRPFVLPAAIAERLGASNRIVRVETAPFADAPPPVVWGINQS